LAAKNVDRAKSSEIAHRRNKTMVELDPHIKAIVESGKVPFLSS
jgi:hypothetical protein